MGSNNSGTHETRVKGVISVGKDLLSLLRDGMLFLLAILLILFPSRFNSILVSAGFEEGSIVNFKWKASLVKSNQALEEAQGKISELQRKNDELVNELTVAKVKLNNPALKERITKLEDENRGTMDATRQVQASISQTIESNLPLIENAQSSSNQPAPAARHAQSDYMVGLQTLGVSDTERIGINEKLQTKGYILDPLSYSYPAGERPSWFAYRSTVFYYSSSAFTAAKQMSQFMKTVTGQEFAVQRGNGLGVDPALKDVTLFVHYIKR